MGFLSHPVGVANAIAMQLTINDAIGIVLMAKQRLDRQEYTIEDFYRQHHYSEEEIKRLSKPPQDAGSWNTYLATGWICGLRPHVFETDNGGALLFGLANSYNCDIAVKQAVVEMRKYLNERLGFEPDTATIKVLDKLTARGISRSATAPRHMVAIEYKLR